MKILRAIGILALVAGLVLGGEGSVFANGKPDEPPGGGQHSPKHGLFGTVASVATITGGEEYLIELETKQGTFDVTADVTAKYMVPRETHGSKDLATFLGIVGDPPAIEGRRLAVLVTLTNEFTANAIRLMLIPSPGSRPLHAHRVGVVEVGAFNPDTSITITDRYGEHYTFTLSGTVYRPDTIAGLTGTALEAEIIGGCVTVVTKGDPKLGPVAKAIVLHDEMPSWPPSAGIKMQ